MNATLAALWFGRELFLPAAGGLQSVELPVKGDEVGAVVKALEGLEPRPAQIRLIYQPADLELHAIDCVKGKRELVRSTLCEEHIALRNPATPWAISRLHPTELGYATLLWIDPKQRLVRLRVALAARGIRLVGAWPLVSLLELTPPANETGQPVLAVVQTDAGGLVYAVTPGGARTVVWASGRECRGQLGGLVRNALSHFDASDSPPVLFVGASAEPWDFGVSPLAQSQPVTVDLDQLLACAHQLSPRDLANFSPVNRQINPNLVLVAASAACFVTATVLGTLYWQEFRRLQNDASVRHRLAATLESDNARLANNQRKTAELQSLEAEMRVSDGHRLRFIDAIVAHKPPEITVHAITIRDRSFELSGTAHEGVGQSRGPFYRFVDALAAKTNPWEITAESRPASLVSSDFTITGTFR